VSAAQIWQALPVSDRPMIMRWWHLPADELPADADMRHDWLDMQWAVLDSWIDARKAARLRQQDPPQPAPDLETLPGTEPAPEDVAGTAADKGYEPTA